LRDGARIFRLAVGERSERLIALRECSLCSARLASTSLVLIRVTCIFTYLRALL
jgi:hypothetical protein